MIPGAYVRGNLSPSDREFKEALGKARDEFVCVLIYHSVPDVHPHCSITIELFTKDMQYLKEEGCSAIALRDLANYVDFSKRLKDIYAPLEVRLGVTVSTLKCDTSDDKPRFSRKIKITRPQTQSTYQILVANSEEILATDTGDLWDSGKVVYDKSAGIAYAGKPLAAGKKFYWQVRC